MSDLSKLRIDRDESARRSSGSGKTIVVLFLLFAVVGTGYFLFRGPLKPPTKVSVTTVTSVNPSQANSVLSASGYVVAQRKAEVASKGTGRLVYLAVEEGTVVKQGQIIGRLESSDMEAELRRAKADLEVAKASEWEAKTILDRKKQLLAEKFTSQEEHDVAEASYKRAVANVEAANARIKSAEVNLENTYIRAPFDGTVLTKNADVGEIVAPFGSAGNAKGSVVSMADMSSLQVEADVSESNIERVVVGQPCEVSLDAFPEKRYRGEVHMVVPTADRAKATVMIKIRFLDKDERVLPEMSAKVSFLTEAITIEQAEAKPKLVLDPAAIADRNGKKVVFVLKGEQVEETAVTLGTMIGNTVEVTAGVSSGTQVVLNPPADMKTGTKIRIGA